MVTMFTMQPLLSMCGMKLIGAVCVIASFFCNFCRIKLKYLLKNLVECKILCTFATAYKK